MTSPLEIPPESTTSTTTFPSTENPPLTDADDIDIEPTTPESISTSVDFGATDGITDIASTTQTEFVVDETVYSTEFSSSAPDELQTTTAEEPDATSPDLESPAIYVTGERTSEHSTDDEQSATTWNYQSVSSNVLTDEQSVEPTSTVILTPTTTTMTTTSVMTSVDVSSTTATDYLRTTPWTGDQNDQTRNHHHLL